MTVEEAQNFVDSGMLGGGMLPKLQNCINAMKTACPGYISWTGASPTASCWRSSRTRVSALPYLPTGRKRYFPRRSIKGLAADKQLMERAEHALYKTYNRFPVVFDQGEGSVLYDTDGKEYLDFGAGIAVMALGYGDPRNTPGQSRISFTS